MWYKIDAIERLENAGFNRSSPSRALPPKVMEDHQNPQQVLEDINAGYKRLDRFCAVLDYPLGDPTEKTMQVYIIPNSFAHIFQEDVPCCSTGKGDTAPTTRFHIYGSLYYLLEQALVESFVKAAIDEEIDGGLSAWSESLRSWISPMMGYLEVNNDILDLCPDKQAVEWYSRNFGRIHEANFGPINRQISKRLGSGKEMPIDMRGSPL